MADQKTDIHERQEAEVTAHNMPKAAPAPVEAHQFEQDGKTYEVMLPKFNLKGKEYTAREAAENEKVRAELVNMAWESNEANTPREEVEFDENGILKLVY